MHLALYLIVSAVVAAALMLMHRRAGYPFTRDASVYVALCVAGLVCFITVPILLVWGALRAWDRRRGRTLAVTLGEPQAGEWRVLGPDPTAIVLDLNPPSGSAEDGFRLLQPDELRSAQGLPPLSPQTRARIDAGRERYLDRWYQPPPKPEGSTDVEPLATYTTASPWTGDDPLDDVRALRRFLDELDRKRLPPDEREAADRPDASPLRDLTITETTPFTREQYDIIKGRRSSRRDP